MILNKKKINEVLDILDRIYPEAECALIHKNPFELIVAVALSAQTTDVSVNKVTPDLFRAFPNAYSMAEANPDKVAEYIKSIGMYKTKSKNLVEMARMLVNNYEGEVPRDYDELIKLQGVGRKTANVVLSVAFGEDRIAVDTHVFRLSNRIGLVAEKTELATELSLMKRIPKERWSRTHHSLIFHGRNICIARNPKCVECPIESICLKKYLNRKLKK